MPKQGSRFRVILIISMFLIFNLILVTFAGLGYFMLAFGMIHLFVTLMFALPQTLKPLYGQEFYLRNADKFAKTWSSMPLRLVFIINNIVIFALSIYFFIYGNIRFLDLFIHRSF